jgi:hypothetical protein
MHSDDVIEGDRLKEWRTSPRNKSVGVPGDDRSPAWTWQTYLHHDGKHVAAPQEWIMAALRYAGAKLTLKGKTTFKSVSQSGLCITGDFLPLLVGGKQIPVKSIHAFADNAFSEHVNKCRSLGFDLSIKRAKIGSSKHVRVRPRFDDWRIDGKVVVDEPAITKDVLIQMFDIAGRLSGLGDWRPSSPDKPGPYGTFKAVVS